MPHLVMRVLRGFRDAWLIAGIALLMFTAAEGAYRLKASLSRPHAVIEGRQPGHPYAGQAWYADFYQAIERRHTLLDPYLGHRQTPLASHYLNIDSAGHRFTPQPAPPPGAPRVVLLGGSAMWGLTARDSLTIAAQLVPALAARGVTGVHVVNLAEAGYNATQEAATLLLELASGRPVDAVVAFNGYNDIATTLVSGGPGHTYSERDAQTLNDFGRRNFVQTVLGLGRFSALIRRLGEFRAPSPPRQRADVGPLCGVAGAWYAGVERSVLDAARGRGIPALIFLQPHNAWSHKPRSAWEEQLPRDPHLAECADSLAVHMAPEAGRAFFNLAGAFDADSATAFVDRHSHVTESANARLAGLIADRLAPLLKNRTRRP